MKETWKRTSVVLGEKAIETLESKTVAIFGVGGVGSYVVEALARSGIGHFVLVDDDAVHESNINRQLIATSSTIGQAKVVVAKNRILDINPDAVVDVHQTFYLPGCENLFDFSSYDYVVDAIDTVSAKLDIICRCKERNVPIISSMGTGNKVNPTMLEVTDISKTEMDPLAKVMRRELKKRHVKKLKVVYSKEKPLTPLEDLTQTESSNGSKRRSIPGSTSFVPSVAGLILASEVVKDLISFDPNHRQ